QSFRRAARVDVGFDPHGLYAFRIQPPAAYAEPSAVAALYRRLIDAARATPGVSSAAYINHSPFSGAAITTTFSIEGRTALDSSNQIFYRTVSAEYLRTMGMTMRAGRWFSDDDIRAPDGVYVINETAAKRYWSGASPIGQHIVVARAAQQRKDFGRPEPGVVIGVVADVHEAAQDVAPSAEVYVPFTHEPWGWGMLMLRTSPQTIPALARAIRAVDPSLLPDGPKGLSAFDALQESIESRLRPRRLAIALIGAFAAASLLLASIGLYGLVAYGVAQRGREMGVRKALGASDARLVRLIVGESSLMIAGGAVLGGAAAFAATKWIRRLLFETSPANPAAYLAALGILAGVALIATLLPARRVARLDPASVLRSN
ncbi:MAG TPA: FtsX-like permease family protein, partial [Vicinamibacterales bacterium]